MTAFDGTATFYANAAGASGGIDGGLTFGPGGILFFTSYPDNRLGQLKPGSTDPDLLIALSSLTPTPIASSVGTLAFVPPGFAGAGRFKVVQYNSPGNWYDQLDDLQHDADDQFNEHVVQPLALDGDAIQEDASTLRDTVTCPDDVT